MQAGPQLDLLVAHEVLGLVPCGDWERMNLGSGGGPVVVKRCQHAEGACYSTVVYGGGGCPRFSSDIRAAWTAVEHLRERGVGVMLLQKDYDEHRAGPHDPSDDQWECGLWRQENG